MSVLSFSCKDILAALLDKSKLQTTRFQTAPRFEEGEKVTLMWHQRTSPKGAIFCSHCGTQRNCEKPCKCLGFPVFNKIIGEVKITSMPIIQMYLKKHVFERHVSIVGYTPEQVKNFAKRDGFKSLNDFERFFLPYLEDTSLEKPKNAIVYRWRWEQ